MELATDLANSFLIAGRIPRSGAFPSTAPEPCLQMDELERQARTLQESAMESVGPSRDLEMGQGIP